VLLRRTAARWSASAGVGQRRSAATLVMARSANAQRWSDCGGGVELFMEKQNEPPSLSNYQVRIGPICNRPDPITEVRIIHIPLSPQLALVSFTDLGFNP
jgi:hypothetical protein